MPTGGPDLTELAKRLGEVVEASSTEFTAQCYGLYGAPPLGGLVRCGDEAAIYGVVFEVATKSMDPGRRPIARGRDEDTEEAVYTSNPQLIRLLSTEFRCLVVGHGSDGQVRRHLGPTPPRIHSFVHGCDGQELRMFSSSLEFIPILLNASSDAADEVTASFLRQASASHPEPERFLVDAGKEVAVLLSGQLQRLSNLLRRLSP